VEWSAYGLDLLSAVVEVPYEEKCLVEETPEENRAFEVIVLEKLEVLV
jgi:hypothetical protein